MLKVGHELSDAEIERRYSLIADRLAMPAAFYTAVAAFAQSASPKGSITVLDLGCGNGELLQALARRFPGARLLGTEIAAGRLQLARCALGNSAALLQVGGRGHIPLADGSVDLVLVTEVIEHLKDPIALLRDIRRLLTGGGRLILTTPNSAAYPLWPLFARLRRPRPLADLAWHFLPFEHPLKTRQPIDTVLAFDETRMLLRKAGFTPMRALGREALPFLMTMPGFRGLVARGQLRRELIDALYNCAGLARFCYRIFWECAPCPTAL